MSNPVTNVDIEDVLSSVRRLVSGAKKSEASETPIDDAAPAHPEKFVLTPALRVAVPEDESGDPWLTESTAQPDTETRTARDSLEATIAELEAAVIAQPDEWEPDGSEITTVPTWATVSYPPLDEVEDAVALEETSPEDMQADVSDHPILTNGPFVLEETEEADDELDGNDLIHLAFARTQPTPEPEPEAIHAAEPEEDFGDELAPEPEVGEDEDLAAFLDGDADTLDEDALRLLVQDIVREELQGRMGERITHNVRKMVRREINRALDMHGID